MVGIGELKAVGLDGIEVGRDDWSSVGKAEVEDGSGVVRLLVISVDVVG